MKTFKRHYWQKSLLRCGAGICLLSSLQKLYTHSDICIPQSLLSFLTLCHLPLCDCSMVREQGSPIYSVSPVSSCQAALLVLTGRSRVCDSLSSAPPVPRLPFPLACLEPPSPQSCARNDTATHPIIP
ncbi:hypothetical protein ILYODFUR_038466 [Ilyodon furcidens]|uniref:Uncharacterized protein n=1 Tax=Ilyodon furcidens TaxID=33524 RepID=A0ABV0T555_9TELE